MPTIETEILNKRLESEAKVSEQNSEDESVFQDYLDIREKKLRHVIRNCASSPEKDNNLYIFSNEYDIELIPRDTILWGLQSYRRGSEDVWKKIMKDFTKFAEEHNVIITVDLRQYDGFAK